MTAGDVEEVRVSPVLAQVLVDIEREASFRSSRGDASFAALAASRPEADRSELVAVIASSAALTERVLKVINSVSLGRSEPVVSVSDALMLIGYDAVKSIALVLSLLDGVANERQRELLFRETARTTAAAALTRELAGVARCDDERAAIQAMLGSLGRMLIAARLPASLQKIQQLAIAQRTSENVEAKRLLGMDFRQISSEGSDSWRLTDDLRAFLKQRPETLSGTGLAATIGNQLAEAIWSGNDLESSEVRSITVAYAHRIRRDPELVKAAIGRGASHFATLARTLGLPDVIADLRDAAHADRVDRVLQEHPLSIEPVYRIRPSVERDATGRPVNFVAALQSSILEINEHAAHGVGPLELTRLALRCLVEQGGYQRALLLVRDRSGDGWLVQSATGDNAEAIIESLRIPATDRSNLLSAALERSTGLTIQNTAHPRVAASLPAWFDGLLPQTRGFILLPLLRRNRAVAGLYADRAMPDAFDAETDLALAASFRDCLTLVLRAAA